MQSSSATRRKKVEQYQLSNGFGMTGSFNEWKSAHDGALRNLDMILSKCTDLALLITSSFSFDNMMKTGKE